MPSYINSAFQPLPVIAIPGQPAYFYGSFPRDTQDTHMRISSVQLTSNVATVTGTIYEGNIPAVGNWISVFGTTSNSGVFNNGGSGGSGQALITAVTGTPSTGVYSISYALTNANITLTTDSGIARIPIAEVPETAANGTSQAIYVPSNELRDLGQKSITVASSFPSLPTAATVTLYTAINNNPQSDLPGGEWTSMGVVSTVAAGAYTAGPLTTFATPAGRFFRVGVTGVTGGTSPTMIVKMLC